ncbi:unnamed protein product [Trichogramma brassicae]|uniref:RNase H type-1 domain-containing protein n=1 Tax=Trichogramma brassicae TaxID=86971 RepID=A0A6H5IZ62_9HYME|nr:unnamed protein product [Trichogramma brassicae]
MFCKKTLKDCNSLLRIDNTTGIAYLNKMGGAQHTHLNDITRKIWQWCERRNIVIFASYIASKENVEADEESRRLEPETEFSLSDYAFKEVIQNFGIPDIDLFASHSNKKCERFISWKKDPESETVDAFTINWKGLFFYAFPPFSIVLKVLRKIKVDTAEGIVIVPDWPGQPWFPLFKKMLVKEPIRFKPNKNLIMFSNRHHTMWRAKPEKVVSKEIEAAVTKTRRRSRLSSCLRNICQMKLIMVNRVERGIAAADTLPSVAKVGCNNAHLHN